PLMLAGLMMALASCSKMDEYKQYMSEGETRYVGRADSAIAYPGKNRILLSWLLISDPNITRCKVYWDNRADSAEISVEKTGGIDTIYLMLENMEERTYNFELFTYDDDGNSSVPVYETGAAYGEKYQSVLLPRLISEAWYRNDTAVITLGAPGNDLYGTQLLYVTGSGETAEVLVEPGQDVLLLTDFKKGASFRYRTLYLPASLAIDTFYTDFLEEELSYEMDRSKWTISGLSSDEAEGEGAHNGRAVHTIDNTPETFWHTQWQGTQPGPPHFIAFDLGAAETVNGLYFEPRQGSGSGNAKDLRIEWSLDGLAWTEAGNYAFPNDPGRHVVFLESVVEARYLKVTVDSSHGDQMSTFFAEVGAF